MTSSQLIIRIAPMYIIPWICATTGVILPGLIVTYGLTISQAGLVTIGLESGNVVTMMALSFLIDRYGPGRITAWGLPVIGGALALTTTMYTFGGLLMVLFLVGAGIALTSSGVNAMVADTGKKRGMYLGILHSGFSVFAIVTPLVAGVLLVWTDWRTYYLLVALLAGGVLAIFLIFSQTAPPRKIGQGQSMFHGLGPSRTTLLTLCLGIFGLAGIQGIIISWGYLYMTNIYQVSHGLATLAPSGFWMGILVGRSATIWVHRRWSARTILLVSIGFSIFVIGVEYTLASIVSAYLMLILLGIGVSGAFQLGTSWAAELIPERIGAASTLVMMSAALGIGLWPWITGMIIDATSFHALAGVVLVGLLISGAMFAVTRETEEQI
jgi:fucose permease